jgi:hypothetical protein
MSYDVSPLHPAGIFERHGYSTNTCTSRTVPLHQSGIAVPEALRLTHRLHPALHPAVLIPSTWNAPHTTPAASFSRQLLGSGTCSTGSTRTNRAISMQMSFVSAPLILVSAMLLIPPQETALINGDLTRTYPRKSILPDCADC